MSFPLLIQQETKRGAKTPKKAITMFTASLSVGKGKDDLREYRSFVAIFLEIQGLFIRLI